MRTKAPLALAVASLTVALTGCVAPHDEDVRAVADAFYTAHTTRDGTVACSQLAPDTKSQLEQSAGQPCADAVIEEEVPNVAEPADVRVFGTQAEVKWRGETTFLARFPAGWKVTAAACRPQPDAPYECLISGG